MKKPTKPKANVIDSAYVKTMMDAASIHNPVAPMAERLAHVLDAIGAMGIRRPNDWLFHFTGSVELRWYDGTGESLGSSKRNVGLVILQDTASIRGSMGRGTYRGEDVISVSHMQIEEALKVLRVLVGMIDTPMTEEK